MEFREGTEPIMLANQAIVSDSEWLSFRPLLASFVIYGYEFMLNLE